MSKKIKNKPKLVNYFNFRLMLRHGERVVCIFCPENKDLCIAVYTCHFQQSVPIYVLRIKKKKRFFPDLFQYQQYFIGNKI